MPSVIRWTETVTGVDPGLADVVVVPSPVVDYFIAAVLGSTRNFHPTGRIHSPAHDCSGTESARP